MGESLQKGLNSRETGLVLMTKGPKQCLSSTFVEVFVNKTLYVMQVGILCKLYFKSGGMQIHEVFQFYIRMKTDRHIRQEYITESSTKSKINNTIEFFYRGHCLTRDKH